MALFREEIVLDDQLLTTELFIEFELFFSDLEKLGGPTKCMQNVADKQFEQKAEFKPVQKQVYKVKDAAQGFCEFVPIQFTDYYNCVVNVQVEATLLDLKIRQENTATRHFFFCQKAQRVPPVLDLWKVEHVYEKYSKILNKAHNSLQWALQDLATAADFEAEVGEGLEPLNLELLPLDKPDSVAETIFAHLNQLAGRSVILQHRITELFRSWPEECS